MMAGYTMNRMSAAVMAALAPAFNRLLGVEAGAFYTSTGRRKTGDTDANRRAQLVVAERRERATRLGLLVEDDEAPLSRQQRRARERAEAKRFRQYQAAQALLERRADTAKRQRARQMA